MKGGLLEYSLDRSQDQIEEVEVEGDLPKDKNKYKKSKVTTFAVLHST